MTNDYVLTSDGSYLYRYPRAAVTADAAVLCKESDGWKVLLIRRGGEPYRGCWALPGGFMNMDETTEECARRELEEETTLRLDEPMLFVGLYDTVGRDPRGRVITATYMTTVESRLEVSGSDDASEARWWSMNDLPELAFDHAKMLARVKEMTESR
ncbi:MAG: NUDIX hydrolase [Paludibacteraceae bacterium]|nr:NUDIX hydrolase [Paludibacteraceae bacterium]